MHLSPAKHVIEQFGGINRTARVLQKDPASVYRWTQKRRDIPKGTIPSQNFRRILKEAKRFNLDITVEDLVFGRNK
jgi:hypothetical protein